jgi:hypothetical protein
MPVHSSESFKIGFRAVHGADLLEHQVDGAWRPWRRPCRGAEVLDDEQRLLLVIVVSVKLWEIRAGELAISGNLAPEEPRGEWRSRGLHECRPTGARDDVAGGGRVATLHGAP